MQPTFAAPVLRILLLTGVGALVAAWAVTPLDHDLVLAANPEDFGVVSAILEFFHGVVPLIMLAVAVVLGGCRWVRGKDVGTRRAGALLALGPFVANQITTLLKALVGRPRPQAEEYGLEGLLVIVRDADTRSFPSGHVTTATAFVIALMLSLPRWKHRRVLLLLIPLMMWDRVALAVHFPSDTLAGVGVACLAMAMMLFALERIDPRIARRSRPLAAALAVLVITWAWPTATRPVDPVTMEEVAGLELRPDVMRTVFEPFVGPALEVAWAPGVRLLMTDLLPWISAGLLMLWFLGPRVLRRRRMALVALMISIWGTLIWTGRIPPDRFYAEREGVFFDPHVHGSDPVDGARDVHFILDRKRARGVNVVALTNHDAPPPVPNALAGSEWSGGRHGEQTFLHLLVLGGSGAFDAVNALSVPFLDGGEGPARAIALDAVRVARSCGAVVIVAHYWRTHTVMAGEGTVRHLPTPDELADAGADGFEVCNRHWEADAEGRAFVERLDALCRARGLLRLGCSDDHGIPAGSPCITFLPGTFPEDPAARREAVLRRLKERGEVLPVVWMRERRAERAPGFIAGPAFVMRYFIALGLPGRLSWLLWFLLAVRWVRGRRETPRTRET